MVPDEGPDAVEVVKGLIDNDERYTQQKKGYPRGKTLESLHGAASFGCSIAIHTGKRKGNLLFLEKNFCQPALTRRKALNNKHASSAKADVNRNLFYSARTTENNRFSH